MDALLPRDQMPEGTEPPAYAIGQKLEVRVL